MIMIPTVSSGITIKAHIAKYQFGFCMEGDCLEMLFQ